MKEKPKSTKAELSRSLSLFSLIMMGVGMMIGSGVFVATGNSIAKGGAGAVIIAFAVNGLIALFTAMSYAELSSAIPRAGGPYNWANYGLGSIFGFIAGWMEWLAASVAGSLYAKTFAKYIVKFLSDEFLTEYFSVSLSALNLFILELSITILVALLFIYINYRGASETGFAAIVFALGQMVALFIIIVFGVIITIKNPVRFQNFTPFLPKGWEPVLFAMGITYVAFEGFEVICQAGDEAIDPKRNIPKALFYSLVSVVTTYILISIAVSLGANNNGGAVKSLNTWFLQRGAATAFTDAVKGLFYYGGWLVPIAVVFSATSALNSTIYSGTRISYALGRDRFLPHAFSNISKKTRVPAHALFATSIIILFIAIFVPIEHVLAAASILFLFVFMIGNISVIKIRKDHSYKLKYGYVMPLFPFLTIIAIVFQIIMICRLFYESLWTWPIVFGWIFIGLLVYFFYSRKHHEKIIMPPVEVEGKTYHGKKGYNILLALSNPDTVENITKLASDIAESKNGELLLFNFIHIPDQSPVTIVDNYLSESNRIITNSKNRVKEDVPVNISIKYGRDKYHGIMYTASENKTKLIILGWMGKKRANYYSLGHTLDNVIENAPCDILVYKPAKNGNVKNVKKIFVASSGGTHSKLAVEMAGIIAEHHNALIDVFTYNTSVKIENNYKKIKDLLTSVIKDKKITIQFELKKSLNVVKSILNDSKEYDLIVLGASDRGIFNKKVFGALPEMIASATGKQLIMVKSNKGLKSFISRWFGA